MIVVKEFDLFWLQVGQNDPIAMKLKLDVSCHPPDAFIKFQVNISKHVEKKYGKLFAGRWRRATELPFPVFLATRGHSRLTQTTPPTDLRRPQRSSTRSQETQSREERGKIGNVFQFNWFLYSSEISDCKSP